MRGHLPHLTFPYAGDRRGVPLALLRGAAGGGGDDQQPQHESSDAAITWHGSPPASPSPLQGGPPEVREQGSCQRQNSTKSGGSARRRPGRGGEFLYGVGRGRVRSSRRAWPSPRGTS